MSIPVEILLAGLKSGRVGVWSWDSTTNRVQWSPNLEAIHGLPEGTFDGTFSFFEHDIHPDDRERVLTAIRTALAEGGAYHIEYRLPDKDDRETVWIEARGEVRREGGTVTGMMGVCQDVSGRKRTELALERHAAQQEVIVRLGDLVLKEAPLQTLFDTAVHETARVLGAELCKLLELRPDGKGLLLRAGVGWRPGLVGTAIIPTQLGSQAGYTLHVDHAVIVDDLAEESCFHGPGLLIEHGVRSGMSVIIAGESGQAYGVLGVHSRRPRAFSPTQLGFMQSVANALAVGIQRRQAAERQTLLVRELRHRVGNLLALILSLFSNTARSSATIDELTAKFEARLLSLSRVHALISERGWTTTGLQALTKAVLEPYLDRAELSGPDVTLSADCAFHLSLALHELATNAVKHGALQTPKGRIKVSWRRLAADTQDVIAIDWIEEGGPAAQPPERRGFGSKLVDALIRRQIGGRIDVDFVASGLRVHIEVPNTSDTQRVYDLSA